MGNPPNPHRFLSATFIPDRYRVAMPITDPDAPAELVASIHQPATATLGECLRQWSMLDPVTRAQSYLVVHAAAGFRHTLNGAGISDLALRMG